MRLTTGLLCLLLLVGTVGWAQEDAEDEGSERILTFGAGIHFTAAENGEFPTGASARIWILRQFGLEVDIWGREGQPSFTIRAFYRILENDIIALYGGGGVAFFSQALSFKSTLQGTGGLDITIAPGLVFDVEIGIIGGGTGSVPVTAGVGLHYYF